jgi:transposase InsO family protein
MSTITVLKHCRHWFSTFGIPDEIVSDNATCFKSFEMQNFCQIQGIKQTFSAPFHHATNGQVERGWGRP